MDHVHITEGGEVIGTLWLDKQGHVADDGSQAAKNIVRHLSRKLQRKHGQQLLQAIVDKLDRSTMVHARFCSEHHAPENDHEERHSTEPTPQDAWPDFGGISQEDKSHRDVVIPNDSVYTASAPEWTDEARMEHPIYDWSTQTHDYDPWWDYGDVLRPEWQDHPLVQAAQTRLNTHAPNGRVFAADLGSRNAVGMYVFGTGVEEPAVLLDPHMHAAETQSPDEAHEQTIRTIDHEFRHAQQELEGEGEPKFDEDDAEDWQPWSTLK